MKKNFRTNETIIIIALIITLLISNNINTKEINFSITILDIIFPIVNPPIIFIIIPIFIITLLILKLILKFISNHTTKKEITTEELDKLIKEKETKVILDENFHKQIKKYLPGYNYKTFKQNLFTIYCRYLHYINQNRIDKIKAYTTKEYFNEIKRDIKKNKKRVIQDPKAYHLTKAKVLYICETENYLEILVDFNYTLNSKKIKDLPNNQKVTFICPIFVKTNDHCPNCNAIIKENLFQCEYCKVGLNKQTNILIHCPNCGNHINPNSLGICEYCKTNYSNIESDWKIKDIDFI